MYDVDPLIDNHVHTKLCHHGTGEMEEYVQSGIKKGLRKITFLEHMEEGISTQEKTWLSEKDFDVYFSEGKRLQKKYQGHLEIGIGVECGYNPQSLPRLISRLSQRQWDQIGISCHFLKIEGYRHHLNLFSRSPETLLIATDTGVEKIINRYFSLLTEAVQHLPGTMLCHLDGALRFIANLQPLHKNHLDKIDALLQAVKDNKMCVEINTSGLSIRKEPFPASKILTMVLSRKIPVVLGSDAHHPKNVGNHFNIMRDYLARVN